MNFLLDTHIFLWYINGNEKLKTDHKNIIENSENEIFISAGSIWEMIVKAKMGKLPLPAPYYDYIISQINIHSFSLCSIDSDVFTHLEKLPEIHKDPFDRILICQAIESKYTLISDDENILKYLEYDKSFLLS